MSFVVGSERGPKANVPRAKRVSARPTLTLGTLRRIVTIRIWEELAAQGMSYPEIAMVTPKPGKKQGYSAYYVRKRVQELRQEREGLRRAE